MASEGMLANAAVTALASAGYLYLAAEVRRRRVHVERRAIAAVLLFGVIGVHLALAASRQLVAYVAQRSPAIGALEVPIFYATVIPAALAIVPLAYMAVWALSGREALARLVCAGFLSAIAVGVFFVFAEGITGPTHTFWSSEFVINSLVAKLLIFAIITLPAFGAGIVLIRAGRGPEDSARRARLVGWSCLIYYGAFTLDALGEPGVWLLFERCAMLVGALVAYRAYFATDKPSAAFITA